MCTVTDLRNCFFTIPLHPDDAPKFAFTVPSVNDNELGKRYHWTVLPHEIKNSPTICQWYVAQTLSHVRKHFPQVYCSHYMDDILVTASTVEQLNVVMPVMQESLISYGLCVAPEKVQ